MVCGGTIAAILTMLGASAASAQTFFVNERGASATCAGAGINACPTIKEAVAQAEKASPPNTIEVEPETGGTIYHESIELLNPKDAGLTINATEPGVVVRGKAKPALIAHLKGAITLSNLKLDATTEAATVKSAVLVKEAALTLNHVEVENGSGEGLEGIVASESASLVMNGGSVEMEGGAKGYAVFGREAAIALNGVKILNGAAAPDPAGGIYSEKSPSLSLINTHVSIEEGEGAIGVVAEHDTAVSMENVAVRQNGPAIGVVIAGSSVTANGLRIEMVRPLSKVEALLTETETPGASWTFSHLEIGGTWGGWGIFAAGGDLTLRDSRVINAAASEAAALRYGGEGDSGTGLLVQRSVLQTGPSAKHSLEVFAGNATVDSSEILGAKVGIFDEDNAGSARTMTLSASTIDAGAPGIAADAAGVAGVEAFAKGPPGSTANVAIQGSIVLEKQVASAAPGDQANIACGYSAVPSQAQAAGGGAGAIACASGSAGNTEANPLSSLFPEPLSGYQLSPSSSAVDSVPAGTLALPFGLTPSSTDLSGGARVLDGNGDCVPAQDKGALELQGHAASCPKPPPPSPKPVAGIITALTISPTAFFAAPRGASISRASKKKYGAKISYGDSQAATATFTILRPASGRRQGKSCRKPSHSNRHGKRCTILTTIGSFTHADAAGADSLHFSGRIKGRKLARGGYMLQVLAHNLAGNGKAVSHRFTIK